MLEAIVFDFDGLILDTESTELQSWKSVYESFGLELPMDEWIKGIGLPGGLFDPCGQLEKLAGYQIGMEAVRARRYMLNRELIDALQIQPGILKLLSEARQNGIKLAIASSSDHAWVDSHLARLEITGYFDQIVCSEDTIDHKPFPEPYLKALNLLETGNTDAIALEDSPNGIAAAKAAGLFCIAVPNEITKNLNLSKADIKIESLASYSLDDFKNWMKKYRNRLAAGENSKSGYTALTKLEDRQ